MAVKRFETAFTEEVFNLLKEVSSNYGLSAKGYVAMAVTERLMADKERYERLLGSRSQSSAENSDLSVQQSGDSQRGDK